VRTDPERQTTKSACAVIFILFLCASASAGEDRSAHRSATHCQYDKEVRLQLRIAEAKRNKDSLLYYKSVARQQKTGIFKLPASACGMQPKSSRSGCWVKSTCRPELRRRQSVGFFSTRETITLELAPR
jgi:hypothetical protein